MDEMGVRRVPVGLRERNRRALRRRLSDTATGMFLNRGFDAVRVSDVAAACGVSTKTVWNHFPTKESLLLDRGERLATALREAAGARDDVVKTVLSCIEAEIAQLEIDEASGASEEAAISTVQAYVRLVEVNPGLRAAAADRLEQLVRLAADALAADDGMVEPSPRDQILAGALISLWRLHLGALLEAGDRSLSVSETQAHVREQVQIGAEFLSRLLAQ